MLEIGKGTSKFLFGNLKLLKFKVRKTSKMGLVFPYFQMELTTPITTFKFLTLNGEINLRHLLVPTICIITGVQKSTK